MTSLKTFKEKLIEKYGNKCVHCGTSENLTVDHIKPMAMEGKKRDLDNMQLLCRRCHNAKDYHVPNIKGLIDDLNHVPWSHL